MTLNHCQLLEEEVLNSKERNWGGRNFSQKCEDIGLPEAYLAGFGLPSQSVHGGYDDLRYFHLEFNNAVCRPSIEWTSITPQFLGGVGNISVNVITDYLNYLNGAPNQELEDLKQQLRSLENTHEDFLSSQNS